MTHLLTLTLTHKFPSLGAVGPKVLALGRVEVGGRERDLRRVGGQGLVGFQQVEFARPLVGNMES